MDFRGIDIRCPVCRSELGAVDRGVRLRCEGAGHEFPVVVGIPDLRVHPDPYIEMEADRAKGEMLAERCAGLSFAESVELYYGLTPKVTASQARLYTRGLMAAIARAEATLDGWWTARGQGEDSGSLLEIGCGTAAFLLVAARRYRPARPLVGIDIAFRWLVLARKRLEEARIEVPLVCACAEALPFRDGSFDRLAAEAVLENVADQARTLGECFRVLRPGGWLFVTTPNRFSLGPDPHTGMWAGGMLPERWVGNRVRRQGGVAPRRRLLWAGELRRLLAAAGFTAARVYLPDIPAGQRAAFPRPLRLLIDLYRLARRLPGGRELLLRVGPQLHAVAERPGRP